MTNYQKGYRFEKKVQKYLEGRGYYVIRSSGSKGLFDLIAFDKFYFKPYGIQCKTSKQFGKDDVYTTVRTALKYNIIPILAYNVNGKIIFQNLNSNQDVIL